MARLTAAKKNKNAAKPQKKMEEMLKLSKLSAKKKEKEEDDVEEMNLDEDDDDEDLQFEGESDLSDDGNDKLLIDDEDMKSDDDDDEDEDKEDDLDDEDDDDDELDLDDFDEDDLDDDEDEEGENDNSEMMMKNTSMLKLNQKKGKMAAKAAENQKTAGNSKAAVKAGEKTPGNKATPAKSGGQTPGKKQKQQENKTPGKQQENKTPGKQQENKTPGKKQEAKNAGKAAEAKTPAQKAKGQESNKSAPQKAQKRSLEVDEDNEDKDNESKKPKLSEITEEELKVEMERIKARNRRCLFIKSVAPEVTLEDIKKVSPDAVYVRLVHYNRNVYLEFESEKAAENNFKLLKSKKIGEHELNVDYLGDRKQNGDKALQQLQHKKEVVKTKFWVGGLKEGTNEEDMKKAFPKCSSIHFPYRSKNNRATNFAFVVYEAEEDAVQEYKNCDKKVINGKQVVVLYATVQKPRFKNTPLGKANKNKKQKTAKKQQQQQPQVTAKKAGKAEKGKKKAEAKNDGDTDDEILRDESEVTIEEDNE